MSLILISGKTVLSAYDGRRTISAFATYQSAKTLSSDVIAVDHTITLTPSAQNDDFKNCKSAEIKLEFRVNKKGLKLGCTETSHLYTLQIKVIKLYYLYYNL